MPPKQYMLVEWWMVMTSTQDQRSPVPPEGGSGRSGATRWWGEGKEKGLALRMAGGFMAIAALSHHTMLVGSPGESAAAAGI